MVKSIRKGKEFERKIAKKLTELTGVKWHRIPQSGATATNFNTENFRGDLFCEDENYKDIIVECKKTKDPITLADLFNPKGRLMRWIKQAQKEADGRRWWLIFSWNNAMQDFIVVGGLPHFPDMLSLSTLKGFVQGDSTNDVIIFCGVKEND